jgi:ppGpp synthetase/RelA/SpoT-type nucleotidyltranferase
MAEQSLKKILEDFEKKLPLYQDFCVSMNKLISNLLAQKKYKYQIYSRVKNLASLKAKMKRKGKGKYKTLSDIKDLAGIRVVFYLESEKEKFLQDLKREGPNIINIEDLEKINGYCAKHAVITLDEKRLELTSFYF